MVSVKYSNVSIAYGDFIVLKNLDLDILDGEITTLLGPSGCGKTTLLRALAGFVEPYEGHIYLGEEEVTILPPQKRNTAMIFQNYALWPHLTIFKNVEYGLKLRDKDKVDEEKPWYTKLIWLAKPFFIFVPQTHKSVSKRMKEEKGIYLENKPKTAIVIWWFKVPLRRFKLTFEESNYTYLDFKATKDPSWAYRRRRVLDVLKLVHLEDQAKKQPTQLSGGQQQRIALCRAIVVEPDVLLCDEPLSNLDAKLRHELRTEIRSIIKKIGMTAIYVTHDQQEALAISDRIAVMNIGNIEQFGTPTEVYSNPHTLFVAQFMGTSCIFKGVVKSSGTVELKGGEIIKFKTKKSIDSGIEVSLIVRPDNVGVIDKTDNPIEVEINTIEYLGTEVKITGKLKDDSILLIDVAEKTEKYAEMVVGDVITAYIKSEETFVFIGEERIY